jgi:hypothetical protein
MTVVRGTDQLFTAGTAELHSMREPPHAQRAMPQHDYRFPMSTLTVEMWLAVSKRSGHVVISELNGRGASFYVFFFAS